jgi:hypothetical protein
MRQHNAEVSQWFVCGNTVEERAKLTTTVDRLRVGGSVRVWLHDVLEVTAQIAVATAPARCLG